MKIEILVVCPLQYSSLLLDNGCKSIGCYEHAKMLNCGAIFRTCMVGLAIKIGRL